MKINKLGSALVGLLVFGQITALAEVPNVTQKVSEDVPLKEWKQVSHYADAPETFKERLGMNLEGEYLMRFGNSLNMSKAKFYVNSSMVTDEEKEETIKRPTVRMKITVERVDGSVETFNTEEYELPDLLATKETGDTNGIQNALDIFLSPGDIITVEDDSTESKQGDEGNPDNTEKKHKLQVEGDSSAMGLFTAHLASPPSGSTTIPFTPGWLPTISFTVTPDMEGKVTLFYNIQDWEKEKTKHIDDTMKWYTKDGTHYSGASNPSEGFPGVFNKYYYAKGTANYAGGGVYHPGGYGGWGNVSQNGNHAVYSQQWDGDDGADPSSWGWEPNYKYVFPFGVWDFAAMANLFFVGLPTDVVKIYDTYDSSGTMLGHGVVTSQTNDKPFTIPAGDHFEMVGWRLFDKPKPSEVVDTDSDTDFSAPPSWEDVMNGRLSDQGTEVAWGLSVGDNVTASGGDTLYILYEYHHPDEPDPSTTSVRWRNQPLGFAEVKTHKFSNDRSTEGWEAMNGTPTTETLYVNAGGTPVYLDVEYVWLEDTASRTYRGTDTAICEGHGEDKEKCSRHLTSDTRTQSVPWTFKTLYINSVTVMTMKGVHLENIDVFSNWVEDVELDTPVDVAPDHENKLFTPSFGRKTEGYSYGFTDGKLNGPSASTESSCYDGPNGMKAVALAKSSDSARAFVQADKFTLRIEGKDYTLVAADAARACVEKPARTGGEVEIPESAILPISEGWSTTHHIDVIGYTGEYDSSSRNAKNATRLLKEGITPPLHQTNGMFTFEADAINNHVMYNPPQEFARTLTGGTPDEYPVVLEYVDYKYPDSKYASLTPQHNSVNPVLFHNPIAAQNIWVHDIPENVLMDQRIEKGNQIVRYAGATDATAPTRNYIDFDFKISWSNRGSFGNAPDSEVVSTFFGSRANGGSVANAERGVLDVTEPTHNPVPAEFLGETGRRGGSSAWGFGGDYEPMPTIRSEVRPPSSGMDCSKWINGKYVRFNVDVRWIKGGDADGGYYEKGTWIQLYNDGYAAKEGDPIEFEFHITSNQKDAKEIKYDFLAEAINIGPHLRVQPIQQRISNLWIGAQELVNTYRERGDYITMGNMKAWGGNWSGKVGSSRVSAVHAAKNRTTQDVIGRMGNVIVDDSSDPRWGATFWADSGEKLFNGSIPKPLITNEAAGGTPVSKYFSVPFGMFEETETSNSAFNSRWKWMGNYHNAETGRLGGLPVMRGDNHSRSGLQNAMIKMGYDIQFSVQTLGDYDNKVEVIPDFIFIDSVADRAETAFGLYASMSEGGVSYYKEYWGTGINPYAYDPPYKFLLAHSLKSPRAKINDIERTTVAYINADPAELVKLGYPSLITIPQDLRTYIGFNETRGNVASASPGTVWGDRVGANEYEVDTYVNAQRWHGRIGLPSSTLVATGDPTNPTWQKKDGFKYIEMFLTFRTRSADGVPWDLTTKTRDNSDASGDPRFVTNVPESTDGALPGLTLSINPAGRSPWNKPRIPVAIFDYTNDSSSDMRVIGTH